MDTAVIILVITVTTQNVAFAIYLAHRGYKEDNRRWKELYSTLLT